MSIKGKYKEIRFSVRDALLNSRYRAQLTNHDFSLITSDCLGGVICHDLKVRMDSPTRNFYFDASDYIEFCRNLDKYLAMSLEPYMDSNSPYLMARCGDVKLYLVHYDSFEQARDKWETRKVRIHKDNMFFIMTDRNHCTEADLKAFNDLPYENKVCFTHIPYPQYESTFYIKGSENAPYLESMMNYVHEWWIRRYYDQFDFVSWLNNGGHCWTK